MTNNRRRLGIDIGGVIIGRESDSAEDTSFFGPNYLKTAAVPNAFESITQLQNAGYSCYLVSKCGAATERKSREWLSHHNFYAMTGIAESSVRFCRKRPDKAIICDELQLTHFIDDRLEVLSYLKNVPHLYLFKADEHEVQQFAGALDRVTRFEDWSRLEAALVQEASKELAELISS